MSKTQLVLTFSVWVFLSLGGADLTTAAGPTPWISLIAGIANPEKFDGQVVLLRGYVSLRFERHVLFLGSDHYKDSIYANGVWLNLDEETIAAANAKGLEGKCVTIVGRFSAKDKGHMGLFEAAVDVHKILDLGVP